MVNDPFTDLYKVGCFAKIHEVFHDERASSLHVFLSGVRRVQLMGVKDIGPPLYAKVEHWVDKKSAENEEDEKLLKAMVQETISLIRQIAQINPLFKEHVQYIQNQLESVDLSSPGAVADFVTAMTSAKAEELQTILEAKQVGGSLVNTSFCPLWFHVLATNHWHHNWCIK